MEKPEESLILTDSEIQPCHTHFFKDFQREGIALLTVKCFFRKEP